ncbi:MAG: SRPBCC family protein [Dehalococcoidia bacterium]
MARFVAVIDNALPVAQAFDYMSHLVHFAEWDPNIRHVEQVAGDGPGPDAVYDVTVNGVRGEMTLRYRVVEFDPPRRLTVRAETRWIESLDVIEVMETPRGSAVTYDARLHFRGVLRLLNPVLGPVLSRIGRRAERGLRRRLQEPGT